MNLASLLDLPAMIAPDAIAVAEHRPEPPAGPVTYLELRSRASTAAGLLRSLGVGRGDTVGLLATSSAAAVECLFAAAAVGATVVPMNFKASTEEAAHLLDDSGAEVLFTEERYRTLVGAARPAHLRRTLYLDGSGQDGYRAALEGVEPDTGIEDVDEDDVAVLLYTSGTTSKPKGVKLTHGSLTRYVMSANDVADGRDEGRMLLAAPIYHVAGLTSLLNALYSGRVTVLLRQFDVDSWLDAVTSHQITHAFLVPTMLARILASPRLTTSDLSSLRSLTYGAAPMPPPVIRRAVQAFPPEVEFAGAYGQTETTSTVAVLGPEDHCLDGPPEEVARKLRRLGSVGRVVDEVELRIVDEHGAELGPDEVGQVLLRTYRVMGGYWGSAEKTRITVDEEGWVHTGDLGFVDADGYLFLAGRQGDMIIRGGENVSPEEVEAVLHGHPAVLDVGVVGVPDEEWGERIVASVVLEPGADVADLEAFAREHLASFKRPSAYHVVEELPRTSTGKLVRRRLLPALEAAEG